MNPANWHWWPAPAKINLFLHILGRREDGYHRLQTVFQLLDWGDRIGFKLRQDRVVDCITRLPDVLPAQNIALRAAQLLQEHADLPYGVSLAIDKQVPMGGGLGGGSSDAATVLLVLNRLWQADLELEELAKIGLRLGADVPLFVYGRSAWAENVGDQLSPIDLGRRFYLLVFPKVRISTAEIFSAKELTRDSKPITIADFLRGGGCRNDCLAVVKQRYPEVAEVMHALRQWGQPKLTGSGSTVFVEFFSHRSLLEAENSLKSIYNVRAVCGVDRSTVFDQLQQH